MSASFLQKISIFCPKKIPLLKAKEWEPQKRFFISVFTFCKIKSYCLWKCFTDYASGIWLPDCSKSAINWKNNYDVTTYRHDVINKFFWRFFISLVNFSYWSNFYVNIIIGSWVMTIFFYKRLTRNPEIGNTTV